jgi:hypothetical protein
MTRTTAMVMTEAEASKGGDMATAAEVEEVQECFLESE